RFQWPVVRGSGNCSSTSMLTCPAMCRTTSTGASERPSSGPTKRRSTCFAKCMMPNQNLEAIDASTSRLAPNLSAAMLSQPGDRDRNEDAVGFWSDLGAACFVLADGAGGHG